MSRICFTSEKAEAISNAFAKENTYESLPKLRVYGDSIYDNHWQVCRLEDLDEMIIALKKMQEIIKAESGVII